MVMFILNKSFQLGILLEAAGEIFGISISSKLKNLSELTVVSSFSNRYNSPGGGILEFAEESFS